MKFYVVSPDMFSYHGLKFQVNWSSERHHNTSQQRLYCWESKNNWLHGVILILLVRESMFVWWGFLFPVVLVPRYKLSLCHTLIKLDLLGFLGIAWPCDHEVRIKTKAEKSWKHAAKIDTLRDKVHEEKGLVFLT
jgi:hypothetical protein